ncbi:MAG: PHP domain-containing protein [Oscillospiraceae bacterium]|nr:PHP domain-containing protein [Oscillospiraceae bacterium]
MKEFKYETHLHTCQGSDCGVSTGSEMVEYYKSIGYAGFFVTDHFYGGNIISACLHLPWEEGIEHFCSGYEDAKRRGDEVGFDVFFGFEYGFDGTEFLIYGLTKEWLLKNPQLVDLDLQAALNLFRESGGFIIHAHPFREAFYIPEIRLLPDLTDAVEVTNICNSPKQNKQAAAYAKKHNLPETCGGDAHIVDARPGGIISPKRIQTTEEFVSLLRSREYELVKKL